MGNEEKLQKVLVDSANKKVKEYLKEYCLETFNSEQYFDYVMENIRTGVLTIPNPQIWVEDDYITNSTTFSLLNVAKEPYSFSQQPANYQIPIDEKNFGENMMGEVTDGVFFSRYIAECLTVLKKIEEFYPTHTIEVHDFLFALYTLWNRANEVLLRKVPDHYKKFFTHHLINPFITSLVCPKGGYVPNIKLIMYDCIGIIAQCSQRKFEAFNNRFKASYELISICTYEMYEKFIEEVIAPMRSMKTITKDFRYWDMEYREVAEFDETAFHNIQALMLGQKGSMNKATHIALELLASGTPLKKVMAMLKEKLSKGTYNVISRLLENDKDKVFSVKHAFKEKNVELMKKRGINFVNYNFQVNLTPYNKVLSEVIINMDEFRKQYPSCTEQQFKEVYLMAQAINSCKREMKSSFKKRKNWALCVKVESGEKPFEFTELLDKLTTELRSEQMDNFITRVV